MVLSNSCREKFKTPPVIPLEDFFRNPEKSSFQISPDGKFLSFMAPYREMKNIFIQEEGRDSAVQLTFETERSVYYYGWKNNYTILYFKDVGGDENIQIFSIDIGTKEVRPVVAIAGVRAGIIDWLKEVPDEIIIGTNQRNPQVFDPYRVNLKTGGLKMIVENPGDIVGWMTDHEGKLRIALASDGVNQRILYRSSEDETFRELMNISFKESFNPLLFTFDNKNLYVLSNLGRDKSAIVQYDPEKNSETGVIFSNDEVDVGGLTYSLKRKILTAAYYVTDKTNWNFFDDETKSVFEDIRNKIPGYEISVVSENKAEDIFLITLSSDRLRAKYYRYDLKKRELTFLHDVSPWLNPDHMSEMKPVQYASRDGLTIHAYLTLPAGKRAGKLPVVVNPHGGPWARDEWGFNPEVQFLANRGYAVFQMNFRGSTGYGKKFYQASFKEWGRKMQDDITDGVNWLIEHGIADPERIAIYGGSYGGYATLAGLTFTPDLYCCGVDYVGVSNMFTFMNTIPPYWKPLLEMFYEMVGDPVKDSLFLAEVSPALHADRIKVPLFIAQGARDPRVNKAESDQMVEALKKRGVEVEYLVKDNEGHGFYNQENQFDFYRGMIGFLDKHMGMKREE
jgi:dipeptidyl aminopeptidase/acylaminoacyl peptidase